MKIAKAGYPFIAGALVLAVFSVACAAEIHSLVAGMLAGVFFILAAFCAYFFRDPARVVPPGDHLILSPADGKIVDISEGRDPVTSEPVWVMRIFLSVFDPHIQRSPVACTVGAIQYKSGKFLDARHERAHFDNEQNRLELKPAGRQAGMPMVVTQIAGLIARRIVWWVKEGQSLAAGEQFGLIRFGSQVDLVMAKSVTLRVKTGERVEAGSTILAEVGRPS